MDINDLIGEMDAQVWTKYWLETIAKHPHIPTDEGAMIGWFANAIMAGFDQGRKVERECESFEILKENRWPIEKTTLY